MPTLIKPDLLHILCDDLDYEKKLFQLLDHERSHVYHNTTKSNQESDTKNEITYCSSFDVTSYATMRL